MQLLGPAWPSAPLGRNLRLSLGAPAGAQTARSPASAREALVPLLLRPSSPCHHPFPSAPGGAATSPLHGPVTLPGSGACLVPHPEGAGEGSPPPELPRLSVGPKYMRWSRGQWLAFDHLTKNGTSTWVNRNGGLFCFEHLIANCDRKREKKEKETKMKRLGT